ncbi:ABC transporter substrate-binding protein [Cohnella nanjingensis]|uniref:Sugar ABC transporter substrate-binding protein n=1 Tax=Cohnella nanjingensis TaxID=1387779 RepID=A0A7X0RYL5_9BACL|nr:sugar ABC transporter substrate-binding protein [Cohnella nanjingensis]MBB6674866.1 sugar ABC transporter substrate-binding protein [Cohnella nanjingensis]
MRRTKSVAVLTLILALFASLMAACAGGTKNGEASASSDTGAAKGKQEVTIVWNEGDVSNEQLKVLLEEFNKKNPDIKVNRISVTSNGWADYFNKIQTMIAGGKAPDVIRVAIEGIQMFAKQDLLLPLDDYMEKFPDALENYEDLHPKLQSPFVVDGKTYGFVWDWNNVVMHFNTDLLKEAGLSVPPSDWTRDDFLRYAQALTTDKDGKKTFGFAIPNYYFGASAWLFNNEASVLDESMTSSKLDDPNAIEMMQFFQDLIYKYKVSPVPNPKSDMINDLISGRVAMISAGKWPFGTYDKTKFKAIDIQLLPKFKTQKVIFGSGAFPVLKSTKQPEAAFKLSAFLSSSFSQKTTLSNFSIPTRISVMKEVLPKTPAEHWQVYADSADIAQPVEAPMQYGEIEGIFNRYMSSILSNQMDAATAMKKAKTEIDAALAKK